jgi:hypothetical protein
MSPERVGFAVATGSREAKNQRKRPFGAWPEFADHRFAAALPKCRRTFE